MALLLPIPAVSSSACSSCYGPASRVSTRTKSRTRTPMELVKQQRGLHSRCEVASQGASSTRRLVAFGGASILAVYGLATLPVLADEDKDGVFGAIQSLLDANTKTKSGRVLPKAYLNSAKQLVKTLRESLQEDPKDNAKFRRTADAAKESIREYLSNWRGQPTVSQEESYVQLEKAIRSLAGFYSKAGPSAPLPAQVKSEILNHLNTAEEFL